MEIPITDLDGSDIFLDIDETVPPEDISGLVKNDIINMGRDIDCFKVVMNSNDVMDGFKVISTGLPIILSEFNKNKEEILEMAYWVFNTIVKEKPHLIKDFFNSCLIRRLPLYDMLEIISDKSEEIYRDVMDNIKLTNRKVIPNINAIVFKNNLERLYEIATIFTLKERAIQKLYYLGIDNDYLDLIVLLDTKYKPKLYKDLYPPNRMNFNSPASRAVLFYLWDNNKIRACEKPLIYPLLANNEDVDFEHIVEKYKPDCIDILTAVLKTKSIINIKIILKAMKKQLLDPMNTHKIVCSINTSEIFSTFLEYAEESECKSELLLNVLNTLLGWRSDACKHNYDVVKTVLDKIINENPEIVDTFEKVNEYNLLAYSLKSINLSATKYFYTHHKGKFTFEKEFSALECLVHKWRRFYYNTDVFTKIYNLILNNETLTKENYLSAIEIALNENLHFILGVIIVDFIKFFPNEINKIKNGTSLAHRLMNSGICLEEKVLRELSMVLDENGNSIYSLAILKGKTRDIRLLNKIYGKERRSEISISKRALEATKSPSILKAVFDIS